MPRGKKSNSSPKETSAVDYRYPHEKRINIPPGRIAGEGSVPKVEKVRYSYSPHLPPVLQFESTGQPDKLNELVDKAMRTPLSAAEANQLRDSLRRYDPWLEWSGKREKRWFEIDPVALHMHERVSTQAILRIAAREDIQRDLFADPQQEYSKAVQFYKHEVDWANRVILGDSLQVMTSLARREALAGKVQMIYVDPPYGVRFASNFQPRFGQREIKDRDQDLTREPETVKAYRDTWTLGIHSYLAYLRDRFILARELLADSGSIFVQISDDNVHRVRCLLEDVFGSENFCSLITFQKTTGSTTKTIPTTSDYLLWFSRNPSKLKFRKLFLEPQPGEAGATEYTRVELANGEPATVGRYNKDGAYSLPESARIYATDSIVSKGGDDPDIVFGDEDRQIILSCKPDRHWKPGVEGVKRLWRVERLLPQSGLRIYKRFFRDSSIREFTHVWTDTRGEDRPDYVVQTSTKVVERCLLMTTDPGDLVLDPTCGSGTTAYVAEEWGRRWITCDSSRVALALAKHRLMTAKFDYYRLRSLTPNDVSRNPNGVWLVDPEGRIPGAVTFQCKRVPHIEQGQIASNTVLDPICEKHDRILAEMLYVLNAEAVKVSVDLKVRLVGKLIRKHCEDGANAVTEADVRRWLVPDTPTAYISPVTARIPLKGVTPKQAEYYRLRIPKGCWKQWEIPFDTDPDWPAPLQRALNAYRDSWRAKMDEVNACIAENADEKELVNKPETVNDVVRVSGPFTVEGVRPEELNLGADGLFDGSQDEASPSVASNHQQNLQAYLDQMVQLIRKDGLTFLNNKRRTFAQVDSLFDAATGAVLHAEGSWEDSTSPELLDVAIGFGPQYGPVTALQVEELIHASKRHNELVVAGFSFDADSTALIQEQSHPRLRIHQAYIRPDVNPGMSGLLKETPDSQLFTVFGTPEIEIRQSEDSWVVHLKGVEVYDPIANTISSTGADKVAAWFLDSDFDGRCFCITQAFFPNQDSWEKIAKALGSAANADAFEAFKGTTSIPFPTGKFKRVAVKVIDPRGNEVMAVRALED